MGRDLYQAACAICHNSPNRAEMVPALDKLPQPTDLNFWTQAITVGKPGTLMPAFAAEHGGPFTPEQISSLARYLVESIPTKPKTSAESAQ
jgi:mono/diheme cytochrome c family protein